MEIILRKLYILPNTACNLSCPHCEVYKNIIPLDEDKFFSKLKEIKAEEYILFGGEPLLDHRIFNKCIDTGIITSMTSNLLLLEEEDIPKISNIDLTTSWNPHRFTQEQYDIWLSKLKMLEKYGLHINVMITLTEDLLSMDKKKLFDMFSDWDKISIIDGINFGQLMDWNTTQEFFDRVDDWLCDTHSKWNFRIQNLIDKTALNWKINTCSNTASLYPDGTLKRRCPTSIGTFFPKECLTCEFASICQPCRSQQHCSFPKKLYKMIKNEYAGN